MVIFDSDGSEILASTPEEPLEHICEIGGQFDECSFYLEFQAEGLDRMQISSALSLAPTKAWNAGERHPLGNGKSGKTRILDYGRWYLKVPVNNEPISDALERFFRKCTVEIDTWRRLSKDWDGCISLVGHANNWNREFALSRSVIALMAERGLKLNIDAYFDGDSFDEEAS